MFCGTLYCPVLPLIVVFYAEVFYSQAVSIVVYCKLLLLFFGITATRTLNGVVILDDFVDQSEKFVKFIKDCILLLKSYKICKGCL